MLDCSQCPAIELIAGKVSGAWLFKDNRAAVTARMDSPVGLPVLLQRSVMFDHVERLTRVQPPHGRTE